MSIDGKETNWIKNYLLRAKQDREYIAVKEELAQAYEFLESSENLLAVLNALEYHQIPQFISTFMRPILTLNNKAVANSKDGSKPYHLLYQRVTYGKPSAIDLICYALVAHDVREISTSTLNQTYNRIKSPLMPHIQDSIRGFIRIMDALDLKSKALPVLPIDCFINLSLLTEPSFTLSGVQLKNVLLEWAYLETRNLSHSDFTGSYIPFGHLSETNLTGSHLENTVLHGSNLKGATLDNACLINADLGSTTFDDASMRNARLSNAILNQASLNNAVLTNASLDGAKGYSVDFDNANLTGATLEGASFVKSDFQNADLSFTILTNADFRDASLKNTKLIHADIKEAHLNDAIFDGTHFFTEVQVKNAREDLKNELDWWHSQIKDLPLLERRSLRQHIQDDLLTKAKILSKDEKKTIYDTAFFHPLFEHRKKTLRGGLNRLFHKKVVSKTRNQKAIAKELLTPKTRKRLHVSRRGITLN